MACVGIGNVVQFRCGLVMESMCGYTHDAEAS